MNSRTVTAFILFMIMSCSFCKSASAEQYRLGEGTDGQWSTAGWEVFRNGRWEPADSAPARADDVHIDTGVGAVLELPAPVTVHSLTLGAGASLELRSSYAFRVDGDLHLQTGSSLFLPSGRDAAGEQTGMLVLEGSLRIDDGALIGSHSGGSTRMQMESAAPQVQTISMPTVSINPYPLASTGVARIAAGVILEVVDATPEYSHASEALLMTGDLLCDGVIRLSGRPLDLASHTIWLGSAASIETDAYRRFGVFSSVASVPPADVYQQAPSGWNPLSGASFPASVRRQVLSADGTMTFPLAAAPLFSTCPITLTFHGGSCGANSYVAVRLAAAMHPLVERGAERYWTVLTEGIDGAIFDVDARFDARQDPGLRVDAWKYSSQRWESGTALDQDGQSFTLTGCGANIDITARAASVTGIADAPGVAASLHAAFPNPFRAATALGFSLGRPGRVHLRVTDAAGRTVAEPIRGEFFGAGMHQLRFSSGRLPAGVYYVTLMTGEFSQTRRLVIAR